MLLMNKKAFTIVELLLIISILGVVSIMAVPNIINLKSKSDRKMYVQAAKDFIIAVQNKEITNRIIREKINFLCPSGITSASGGVNFLEIDSSSIGKSPKGNDYRGIVAKKNGKYYVCITDGEKTVVSTAADLYEDNAISNVVDYQRNDCLNEDVVESSPGDKIINKVCSSS